MTVANSVTILKTIQQYTLNWWIVLCVNYISTKLLTTINISDNIHNSLAGKVKDNPVNPTQFPYNAKIPKSLIAWFPCYRTQSASHQYLPFLTPVLTIIHNVCLSPPNISPVKAGDRDCVLPVPWSQHLAHNHQ